MPKLQFLTANILDGHKKVVPEAIPRILYSCKTITAKCEIPTTNRKFSIRLSSGPIPFDMVVKIFLNGVFLTGRCFLSGSTEPIYDYEIGYVDDLHHNGNDPAFQFNSSISKLHLTVHKCCVGSPDPAQALHDNPDAPRSTRSRLQINEWTRLAPIILHEEQEPFLSILWEVHACHPRSK